MRLSRGSEFSLSIVVNCRILSFNSCEPGYMGFGTVIDVLVICLQ
jgi:hypothetical protein